MINENDLQIIINIIYDIIMNDHDKIKKLISYLRNIASLFIVMNIPIIWILPSGLQVNQGYLECNITTIKPFQNKDISLYIKFVKTSTNPLFYSIHDCFAVAASNIDSIKILLSSIYIDLYSDNDYLKNFDLYILKKIKSCT